MELDRIINWALENQCACFACKELRQTAYQQMRLEIASKELALERQKKQLSLTIEEQNILNSNKQDENLEKS
jgi:hypothetical protein